MAAPSVGSVDAGAPGPPNKRIKKDWIQAGLRTLTEGERAEDVAFSFNGGRELSKLSMKHGTEGVCVEYKCTKKTSYGCTFFLKYKYFHGTGTIQVWTCGSHTCGLSGAAQPANIPQPSRGMHPAHKDTLGNLLKVQPYMKPRALSEHVNQLNQIAGVAPVTAKQCKNFKKTHMKNMAKVRTTQM